MALQVDKCAAIKEDKPSFHTSCHCLLKQIQSIVFRQKLMYLVREGSGTAVTKLLTIEIRPKLMLQITFLIPLKKLNLNIS